MQTNHATLEMALKLKNKPTKTSYLIVLEVDNEDVLENISELLNINNINHHMFFEPDEPICGFTAICTEPVYGSRRNFFKKYKLWKHFN